ncbi:MAG: decarboxylating 6-phosphogluconate dehydrogenase [SAR202 cluster bacterium]|jgi:6-phosphogluconate dehydrogenase|nr:decarboxylating 6-phosphogluconate dehydrogenase [SAR202 cluster bacterium]|tara:strand:- start:882 stop:1790 length:909 start_codon:yes stop_codon:yes gene_type:complete
MELGMVGLGRMGGNMAQRLLTGGHHIVAFDPQPLAVKAAEGNGADGASSLDELVSKLTAPKAVWVMVPDGAPTESTIKSLAELLSDGDMILDGGNSNFNDSIRRSKELAESGIEFMDVGTSGGVWGLTEGYSMMVGGSDEAFARIEPLIQTLAPSPTSGYGHVGPAGAGHYVKMVHNGIEYGLMQAYAEGFELMNAREDMALDMAQIAEIWREGSVVRSWLLDLTAAAFQEDGDLSGLAAYVDDSGEGRWTVQESVDLAVPIPVITAALQARFRSRQDQPFGAKILSAMRNQFGGHAVRKAE